MPIELLVPLILFYGGVVVMHITTNAGMELLERKKR